MQSDRPVLVDFWAPGAACRMLAPTVEQVAEKYHGKAKVVKLNVDENIVSGRYGIRGIPTLVLWGAGLIVTWACRSNPLRFDLPDDRKAIGVSRGS